MWRENEEREGSTMENPTEGGEFGLCGKTNGGFERKEVMREVKKQLWLAGPLISVSLLHYFSHLIFLMFVGHLGKLPLSAASMATSFATVTGFSLLMGMASALDTLCGQAYGAKQYHMLGVHMQRSMVVQFLTSIPLSVIWANTGHILKFLGQDPVISHEAGVYAKFLIPCIFAYSILQCEVKFLQTQNNVIPMMITTGFSTIFHLILCWILVFKTSLGKKGPALALGLSYWTNFLLLALYIKFFPACKKTWTGFSMEAFSNIPRFLKLAIPSALMICLESWSFELMVLLSGLLHNPQLETSVLSTCLNTAATVWMIPYGLSNAVSTRVSNELGAGHPKTARLAVCVVLIMAIIEGILVGFILIMIRNIWGRAYSNVTEVVKYVATMMPLLATSNLIDGLQCVLSGIVRGSGRQKIGACINLGSYYLVGIPTAVVLAFVFHIGGKSKKAMDRVSASTVPVEIPNNTSI